MMCCDVPLMTFTEPSCANNDGTATATGQGGNAPYDYDWSDGQTHKQLLA